MSAWHYAEGACIAPVRIRGVAKNRSVNANQLYQFCSRPSPEVRCVAIGGVVTTDSVPCISLSDAMCVPNRIFKINADTGSVRWNSVQAHCPRNNLEHGQGVLIFEESYLIFIATLESCGRIRGVGASVEVSKHRPLDIDVTQLAMWQTGQCVIHLLSRGFGRQSDVRLVAFVRQLPRTADNAAVHIRTVVQHCACSGNSDNLHCPHWCITVRGTNINAHINAILRVWIRISGLQIRTGFVVIL